MTERELTEREIFNKQMLLAVAVLGTIVIVSLAAITGAVLIAKFVGGWSSGLGFAGVMALMTVMVRSNKRIARQSDR